MLALHLSSGSDPSLQQRALQQRDYLPLLCDVRIRSTILAAFQTAISHLGSIDVIVNCSSYAIVGACEDQSEADIRDQFETNFMGTLSILQLSLPYFRQRQAGRYVIFNGTSGALGMPGQGPYCATKCAVEGLVESMLYEVENFGVKATLVFGGPMRTDENQDERAKNETDDGSRKVQNRMARRSGGDGKGDKNHPGYISRGSDVDFASSPYSSATSPASHFKRTLRWIGDNQPTSAIKAAELLWQLGHCSYPPLRLLLGNYAVESTRDRMRSILEEVEDWKHLDFASTGSEFEVSDETREERSRLDSFNRPGESGTAMAGDEDEEEDEDEDEDEEDDEAMVGAARDGEAVVQEKGR